MICVETIYIFMFIWSYSKIYFVNISVVCFLISQLFVNSWLGELRIHTKYSKCQLSWFFLIGCITYNKVFILFLVRGPDSEKMLQQQF